MTKKELRKLYLPLRKKIPQDIYHKMNKNIHKLFFEHFVLSVETKLKVHTYLSNNDINEIDTWGIIKDLEKKTTEIYVPKINEHFTNNMNNCLLSQHSTFKKNKWNIYEPNNCNILNPSKLNLIIIPCIVCDLRGYRVGYGKGYYDRFLSKVSKKTIKVTLSAFALVEPIEDIKVFDIPMDYCITPDKIVCLIEAPTSEDGRI